MLLIICAARDFYEDLEFEDYLKKTEELVKSLLSFNKMANESVIICDKISKKNRKDDYNEKNIRDMINEIMNLERKHFNDKNHEETENLNRCVISKKTESVTQKSPNRQKSRNYMTSLVNSTNFQRINTNPSQLFQK